MAQMVIIFECATAINDGLTDGEELAAGSSSESADTDGDGFSDYDEVKKYGTDPADAASNPTVVPPEWGDYQRELSERGERLYSIRMLLK